jgi:hypothetical protein
LAGLLTLGIHGAVTPSSSAAPVTGNELARDMRSRGTLIFAGLDGKIHGRDGESVTLLTRSCDRTHSFLAN